MSSVSGPEKETTKEKCEGEDSTRTSTRSGSRPQGFQERMRQRRARRDAERVGKVSSSSDSGAEAKEVTLKKKIITTSSTKDRGEGRESREERIKRRQLLREEERAANAGSRVSSMGPAPLRRSASSRSRRPLKHSESAPTGGLKRSSSADVEIDSKNKIDEQQRQPLSLSTPKFSRNVSKTLETPSPASRRRIHAVSRRSPTAAAGVSTPTTPPRFPKPSITHGESLSISPSSSKRRPRRSQRSSAKGCTSTTASPVVKPDAGRTAVSRSPTRLPRRGVARTRSSASGLPLTAIAKPTTNSRPRRAVRRSRSGKVEESNSTKAKDVPEIPDIIGSRKDSTPLTREVRRSFSAASNASNNSTNTNSSRSLSRRVRRPSARLSRRSSESEASNNDDRSAKKQQPAAPPPPPPLPPQRRIERTYSNASSASTGSSSSYSTPPAATPPVGTKDAKPSEVLELESNKMNLLSIPQISSMEVFSPKMVNNKVLFPLSFTAAETPSTQPAQPRESTAEAISSVGMFFGLVSGSADTSSNTGSGNNAQSQLDEFVRNEEDQQLEQEYNALKELVETSYGATIRPRAASVDSYLVGGTGLDIKDPVLAELMDSKEWKG